MNQLRILAVSTACVVMAGCGTTDPQARAKTSQLRVGMTQGQVSRIFGQPNKIDRDDGYHHGHYVPYYGWRGGGSGEAEQTWEYDKYNLEVKFRRSGGTWVVSEWDM